MIMQFVSFMNHYFVVVEQITSCLLFIPINPLKPYIHHILYDCVPKNLLVHSCRVNEETCTYAYFINRKANFYFYFYTNLNSYFCKIHIPFPEPKLIFFVKLHTFPQVTFILNNFIYPYQADILQAMQQLPSNAGLYKCWVVLTFFVRTSRSRFFHEVKRT